MRRITQRTVDVAPHYPNKLKKKAKILNVGPPVCDTNILLVITGSAGEQSDETGTSGNHFYFKARKGTSLCSFVGQSFSTTEAGTLPAAPDCWRTGTAGSPRGRCCRRTAQVGMGWYDRWLGPGIHGQIL